jgi:hypothetical protein
MDKALRLSVCVAIGLILCGCQPERAGLTGEQPKVLPTYDEVYARAEERVGAIDRFWATAVVGLRYVDAEGKKRRQQGEGHFQVVKPANVALTIGKLGETYLILGCDDDQFWWIERLEENVAYVGDQQGARDLAFRRMGVPVLPTDLLMLADLNAWPAAGTNASGVVAECERDDFDASQIFAVKFVEPDRTRVVYLTRLAFEPVGVDLISPSGELIARSNLSNFVRVLNRIDPLRHQRVPTRVTVDVPSAESRIEMTLSRAEISNRRPKPLVFDLNELIRRFRIDTIVRLEDIERKARP